MHSRSLQLPDRRASGSADRIERQARTRLASVALDLKPSEPAVEALSNGRRRLRWAAIGFHPDRPQFGLCAVGIALSLLRQLNRVLGADFRAHHPAAEDDLAFLGAHGWRLQPPLRRRAMPPG